MPRAGIRGPRPVGKVQAVRPAARMDRRAVEERAERALAELLDSGMGTKPAARIVADLTGLSTRKAYALALKAKERDRS